MQEEIIDLSELMRPAADSALLTEEVNKGESDLQPEVSSSAGQVPPSLHEGLEYLSAELRHLLDYLELIEDSITQEVELQKTVLIFRFIYNRSLFLIDRINTLASEVGTSHETLQDALDTTGFAIQHEIRRVYEIEAPGLTRPGTTRFSRSELTRAYGLLQNCFQQSAITLARVFNPTLDGDTLFEDYKVKREQALVLRGELALLLQKVSGVEREAGVLHLLNIINSLKRFRQETMHFLMYRDWEEFEGFVDEIVKTYDGMGNLGPVLHRFARYLETLLKHVSMRAVLNDEHLFLTETTT